MSLYKAIKDSFENVAIDNMKHIKSIYQAFLINDRFHLIKWKQGYYDGAFEVMDKKYKNKNVFLSTNLQLIINKIKEWERG